MTPSVTSYGMWSVMSKSGRSPEYDTKCPECGQLCKGQSGLKMHWGHSHALPAPWWPSKQDASDYGKWWEYSRKRVLERDDSECQNCESNTGERFGEDLHVHHIRPLSELSDAGFPHALDNLVVLCVPCHRLLEKADEDAQRAVLARRDVFHPAGLE